MDIYIYIYIERERELKSGIGLEWMGLNWVSLWIGFDWDEIAWKLECRSKSITYQVGQVAFSFRAATVQNWEWLIGPILKRRERNRSKQQVARRGHCEE